MSDLNIIMGPAGCGKSSVAAELSARTGWVMIEADDHHPIENVEKQRNRIPLTDDDRVVWLDRLIAAINAVEDQPIVLACSALTPYVQNRLRTETDRRTRWLLIDVPADILKQRLIDRTDHFMPAELLDSQLASLYPPTAATRIRGDQSVHHICNDILNLT